MPGPADTATGRACTATTLAGRPCRRWAIRRTDPPRCHLHAYPDAHGRLRHSYYRRTPFLPAAVQAALDRLQVEGPPLAAELALARLQTAALLAYLGRPGLAPAASLPAYRLALRALRTVARLVRTQHALTTSPETNELSR